MEEKSTIRQPKNKNKLKIGGNIMKAIITSVQTKESTALLLTQPDNYS